MAEEATPEEPKQKEGEESKVNWDSPDASDVGKEPGYHFHAQYVGEILDERLAYILARTTENIELLRKLLPYFTSIYTSTDQRLPAEEHIRKVYEEQAPLLREFDAIMRTVDQLQYPVTTFNQF